MARHSPSPYYPLVPPSYPTPTPSHPPPLLGVTTPGLSSVTVDAGYAATLASHYNSHFRHVSIGYSQAGGSGWWNYSLAVDWRNVSGSGVSVVRPVQQQQACGALEQAHVNERRKMEGAGGDGGGGGGKKGGKGGGGDGGGGEENKAFQQDPQLAFCQSCTHQCAVVGVYLYKNSNP